MCYLFFVCFVLNAVINLVLKLYWSSTSNGGSGAVSPTGADIARRAWVEPPNSVGIADCDCSWARPIRSLANGVGVGPN